VIVLGGFDADRALWDGAAYDPATDTWTPIPEGPSALSPWEAYRVVWTGSVVLQPAVSAAWDPAAGAWVDVPPDPRAVAEEPATGWAWTGSELVVVGRDDTGLVAEAYDPDARTWRELPPPPVEGPLVADWADRVGVGAPSGGAVVIVTAAGRVDVLDLATETWTTIDDAPVAGGCGDAFVIGDTAAGWIGIASCGRVATQEADGGWLVQAEPLEAYWWSTGSRTATGTGGIVAWSSDPAIGPIAWAHADPAPGTRGELALGPVRLDADLGETRVVASGPRDVGAVVTPGGDPGAACRVDVALDRSAFSSLRARSSEPGAEIVVVRPDAGGPGHPAVAVTAAAGATIGWGHDESTTVAVTCPGPAAAMALAAQVGPPASPVVPPG
jgi:hypothetical protein